MTMLVRGLLPVIPTPFVAGAFDPGSFGRLLDHMLPALDGYTLLGSTGEAPSLSTRERMEIAEAALAMTPADKTVVVGISHTSADESIALARHARDHGAAAVLCSAPYYFDNCAAGLLSYFRALAAKLELPLVLYDNPAATKTVLPAQLVLELAAELEQVQTIKLTDHDLAKVAVWQEGGLSVLAGDDTIVFRSLAAGVDGAMVIAPAVFPSAFRAVWDAVRAGDTNSGLAIFSREILPFIHVFGVGDEIATTKALMHDVGLFESAEVRPPLVSVDADRRALLRQAYELGVCESRARESAAPLS